MTVVIGTAGHIDHGKTTLLRALTGIDADRLPEEQRRGMTIDVGYAWLDLEDGTSIDFVDVPGHDALIGNMLVGAGEIDAALLVVAADDGIRAQTREHVALLDALAIPDALVAITKVDLVAPERAREVGVEVAELLATTSMRGARVIEVSGTAGTNLDRLRAEVVALRDRVAARRSFDPPADVRLAIDRAFTVRGRGAVATGTLRGGQLRAGDRLRLLPAGLDVRVRGLQVHHAPVTVAEPGRVAVNLAGVELEQLERGGVLAEEPALLEATDRPLVALAGPAAGSTERAALRLHLGTASVGARIGRRGRAAVDLPDGRRTAMLRLDAPIATAPGDRAVLREPAGGGVVAGVVVLEPVSITGPSRARVTPERLATLAMAVAEDQAEIGAARLALRGLIHEPELGMTAVAGDVSDALHAEAMRLVAAHHAAEPDSAGLPGAALRAELRAHLRRLVTIPRAAAEATTDVVDRAVEDLVARGRLARDGERLRDPRRAAGPSPALAAAMDRLVAILDVAGPADLSDAARAAGCPPEGIRALEAAGRIVRVEADLAWAAPAWERLTATALDLARQGPLAPSALRDATGSSRRTIMPALEELGRRGLLVRTPAGHVLGPRAPR